MLDDLDLDTRSALARALRSFVERKFNKNQLRDPGGEGGGQWVKAPSAGEVLRDVLKLGSRKRNKTELAPGEELLGSDVLSGKEGAEVLMAFTRRSDGSRTVRIATGVEDKADWSANNRGGTAVLDERGIGRLRDELDRMVAAEADYKDRYKAADKAWEAAKRRERALVHKQYPNLSATDRKTLDRLDDETIPELDDQIASKVRQQADADSELSPASQQRAAELTARVNELERERQTAAGSRLDEIEREVRALIADHAELHEERETGSPVGYAFLTRRRLNELRNFRRERDAAIRHRAALTADRVPLSPADADALDRARADAAETFAVLTEDLSEIDLVDGTVPGEWTDVGFKTDTDELGNVRHAIDVRPSDATDDWYPGQEGFGPLTTAELKKLSAMLAAGMEGEPVGDATRGIGWRRELREIIRKFNPEQLRDPGGEGGGRWIRALAEIIDDVSFEALNDVTVYQGLREDGVIDLGVGGENGPTVRFSYHDVDALSDSAYALWRKRDSEQDENGLIDDDIVDTSVGQRIYLAISQKQIYTADPDDPDDEDDFGPVLTVGIPTAKDSEESPDFHEFDLDEDGFDNLIGNLEAFRDDYELVEVDAEGAGDYDVTLMSDHSIQLNDGSAGSTPTLSTDQASGLAAAIERLLARELPDEPSDPPDVIDEEDLAENLDVSLLEDGNFVITLPHNDGYIGVKAWDREDAEQLADSLKTMVRKDRTLPDSRPSGSRGGTVRSSVSRTIPYDPPHAPAGSPTGGQFTTGGGGGSSTSAKNKRGTAGKSRPRKRAQPGAVLAYDPATNQGTGYGSKNGDDRVHMMQQALNRMGMTDAAGKELRDDGKLGPKTTAAMKKLQKAMGMTPNGRVTPAMLDLMKNATSLDALKKAVAAAKGAKNTMPARRSQIMRSDTYHRSFPLDDIQIMRSGDGRTVEAYAAMFDVPYEVRDQHGHYNEVIHRAAFNRTLNGGAGKNAMCLYNHGMTLHGTPDMMGSVPLGAPLEIKPDGRGLLTVTRYNKGPFADQVLESIRNGDIKAQSFRGQIFRSDPTGRPPKPRYGQPLPTITRHELGLSDYGPTPVPVNDRAAIVAVRSLTDLINDFASLTDDDRWELLRTLDLPTLDGDPGGEELEDLDEEPDGEPAEDDTATSDHSEPGAEEPPAQRSDVGHSGRFADFRRHIRTAMVTRGMR